MMTACSDNSFATRSMAISCARSIRPMPHHRQAGEFTIEGVIVQRNIRRQIKHYTPYTDINEQTDTADTAGSPQ